MFKSFLNLDRCGAVTTSPGAHSSAHPLTEKLFA